MAVCAQRMGMSTQGDNEDIETKYVEGKITLFSFWHPVNAHSVQGRA
jgi:hypothetical protein